MCVGKTLNMDSCSKFWGNLEEIWGKPRGIPYIGWKIPRVYRVRLMPSPLARIIGIEQEQPF